MLMIIKAKSNNNKLKLKIWKAPDCCKPDEKRKFHIRYHFACNFFFFSFCIISNSNRVCEYEYKLLYLYFCDDIITIRAHFSSKTENEYTIK